MDAILERMEEIEEDLALRAFLFDNPVAYREGIQIAFEAVRAELERSREAA